MYSSMRTQKYLRRRLDCGDVAFDEGIGQLTKVFVRGYARVCGLHTPERGVCLFGYLRVMSLVASTYVSIPQHTSAYLSIRQYTMLRREESASVCLCSSQLRARSEPKQQSCGVCVCLCVCVCVCVRARARTHAYSDVRICSTYTNK